MKKNLLEAGAMPDEHRERADAETAADAGGVSTDTGKVGRWHEQPGPFAPLVRALPTVSVLAGLAAILWWGHHSDWTLPKFSALAGAPSQQSEEWCPAHGVPEEICVECRKDLLPDGEYYGWCNEHGLPQCPLCHPDVAQLKETPKVDQADVERAKRALALKERPANNRACLLHRRRIQFVSHEAVVKSGIDVDLADRRPIVEAITAVGEIVYDQTRVARLSSRVPGTVWRVEKQIGDSVKKGEVLALVDAMEVGRAKSELLAALTQWDLKRKRLERLRPIGGGAVAAQAVSDAEAAEADAAVRVRRAVQTLVNLGLPISFEEVRRSSAGELLGRLQFLGIPEGLVDGLEPGRTTSNLIPLTSPLDGEVTGREVVAGEVVDSSQVLFTVADVGRMWLMFDIPLEDAKYVQRGQKVQFRPDGVGLVPWSAADRNDGTSPIVTGKVTWMSTSVDDETRTVAVRADVPNPDGRLRNETFGTGRIVLREEKGAIVVPSESVHWDGTCRVVFVRNKNYFDSDETPKVFHTRTVRIGAKTEDFTEIIAGVLPREVVATKGSGVLRGELLKNNLGAG